MDQNQTSTLGREDWFSTGLEALVEGGPEALKAARLARVLGVTTGSFYWHFQCVADFRSGLLEYWREDVVIGLIRAAQASAEEPAQVLAELQKRVLAREAHRYDSAMRRWALTDPAVQDTLRSADDVRARFLVEALQDSGMSEEDARDRANLIGAAWRGSQDVGDPDYRMKLIGIAASE
jgi:AcrR family transcriptional regulator